MKQCKNCGKELKDATSKKRGYGPECWNKLKAKDRLNMQIILITGDAYIDEETFSNIGSAVEIVATFDLREVGLYESDGLSLSNIDFSSQTVEELIGETLHHEHQYGGVDVNLYVRKKMVAAGVIPKVPPNMIGLPMQEASNNIEEAWSAMLGFHSQRIDMMKMSPWKWIITKEDTLSLNSKMEVCTGSLFMQYDPDWETNAPSASEDDWIPCEDELEAWEKKGKGIFWDENPELSYLRQMLQGKIISLLSATDVNGILGNQMNHPTVEQWMLGQVQLDIQYDTQHLLEMTFEELDGDLERWEYAEAESAGNKYFDWMDDFDCENEDDWNFWKLRDFFEPSWLTRLYDSAFEQEFSYESKKLVNDLSNYDKVIPMLIKNGTFACPRPLKLGDRVKIHMWCRRNSLIAWRVNSWLDSHDELGWDPYDMEDDLYGQIFGVTDQGELEMNHEIEDLGKEILEKIVKYVWKTDTETFQHNLLED